ncbi:MAG: hypothetical protein AB2L14_21730 [Candidatus Xenobiia bacterium LiM19]
MEDGLERNARFDESSNADFFSYVNKVISSLESALKKEREESFKKSKIRFDKD